MSADDAPLANRRRFLKLLGLVGMSSAIGSSGLVMAQTSPTPSTTPEPAKPDTTKPDTTKTSAPSEPVISEDARALAAIVQRRYGAHLDAKQLEAVTREIENRLQGGKALRAAKLANADEPDATFRP